MNSIAIVPSLSGNFNSKWDDENLENISVHVFISFAVTLYSSLPSWFGISCLFE
jgi:hypothetical protein